MHTNKKTIRIFGWNDNDLLHHIALFFILALSVLLFFAVSPNKMLQFGVACLAALAYVLWGVIHHRIDGDYHFKNVIEYVLVALLGVLILGGVLL